MSRPSHSHGLIFHLIMTRAGLCGEEWVITKAWIILQILKCKKNYNKKVQTWWVWASVHLHPFISIYPFGCLSETVTGKQDTVHLNQKSIRLKHSCRVAIWALVLIWFVNRNTESEVKQDDSWGNMADTFKLFKPSNLQNVFLRWFALDPS